MLKGYSPAVCYYLLHDVNEHWRELSFFFFRKKQKPKKKICVRYCSFIILWHSAKALANWRNYIGSDYYVMINNATDKWHEDRGKGSGEAFLSVVFRYLDKVYFVHA